ncbi:U3 small nucleolar ribonucleoprotein protein MPP10-like [Ostrinia nubilalis]|uniref:U3 small nucleolar ribonucleoprotein protein MPP10-like n=1 Tax=Ostrinia nubilalis TaxID=29057 RepID=UPI0030823835
MTCPEIEDIIQKFNSFTEKPVNFLTVQSGIKDDVKNLVKSLYDYTKSEEPNNKKKKKTALRKLIVQDFDEEQIWQQIELQNTECWDQLVWDVANCVSAKKDLVWPVETGKKPKPPKNVPIEDEEDCAPSDEQDDGISEAEGEDDMSEAEGDDDESEKPSKKSKINKNSNETSRKKFKPSIVDDKFFKLQEMEKFLLDEEKKEGKKGGKDESDSEEELPLFEDIDDEGSGEEDMMYTDFFGEQEGDQDNFDEEYQDEDDVEDDLEMEQEQLEQRSAEKKEKSKKKDKRVTFADESSDDDSDDSTQNDQIVKNLQPNKDEKKSDFELRQQRLQQTITRLEEKNLKEAPWQLKGEVDATKRPQNSLLQEVVDFDLTSRPAPIITEQTTITLEDIIKRRVKDKAWDDVVRKEKPVDDQLSFRKKEIIDQSKSKQSLAQVYEAEYLKQKQALSGDVEDEKEPELYTEIRESMDKVFAQLDALCNYHYTPKAPQAEVKIVNNTPAISMEEVAPIATSDANLLAPEEVKKKRRGDLMSKEERTQTDKNRERRKKKKLQRKKGGVTKVTDNRNTKKGVEASDKLKTSKAFFQQLNDDSTSLIKSKNKRAVKNKGQ